MIHRSVKSYSLLGIQNIAYNTELWDGKHHTLLMSEYSEHLEANTKMFPFSLKHLACFIKQHPLGGHPIEQFPTILGVGSYIWNLIQAISESGWNHFKISSQSNAPTFVETMRTVYGPNLIPTLSSDVEMVVNTPETEKVTFILVTNKKGERKAKVSFLPPTNSRSNILLVSRTSLSKIVIASSALKLAITYPTSAVTAMTSKPTQLQNASLPVFLASKPKPKAKSFTQATKANNTAQQTPRFAPASFHEKFCVYYSLRRFFLTSHRLLLFPYTRPAQVVQKFFKEV